MQRLAYPSFLSELRTPIRVLVVDDVAENRHLLERLLVSEGYRVSSAADGAIALGMVDAERPDLIISDIHMPDLDGIELCRRVKSNTETRLVPFILVTGMADRANRIAGIEAGADDFLSKPFDTQELKARVRSLLRLKRYTDELDSAESIILSLALTIEARDPYTHGHCQRLAAYALDAGGQHRPRQVGADDTPARLDERRGVARGAAPDVDRDTVRHARELAGGKLHQHGIRRRTHETRDGVG